MNLDACTPGQRQSIECVDGPLLVSAGAGSGKTFTLTQRIAYALLPESGPAVNSIDEVLAITFTEKAAAEIKARVKRTLRAEGLGKEALLVDGAWISTIHGMCARILRAHALDLGLDPAFGIMGDAERSDALADAIDGAVRADGASIAKGSYARLFNEYKARSSMPSEPSVASMLRVLLDRASSLRGGLEAVDFGPDPELASALARELLLAYEGVQPALARAKSSASSQRAQAQALDAIASLEAFLADRSCEGDMKAFSRVADACAFLPCTFGDAEVKAQVKAYQSVHASVAQRVALGLARPVADELMALAHEVSARYEAIKRIRCKLDNDDLLVRTLDAFERFPDIAQRYEKRFKLVMVDEFQDTSQLQIDMIARLAGSNFAHLCTVGDAQQSIYRFRGADVNVYEAHKNVMRSDAVGSLYVELTKNFRSHADVLSFVDRVFEQPGVFGDSFMSLEPHLERASGWQGSGARIDLVLAMQPAGTKTGVRTDDVKRAGAEAIAKRFAALRADGHKPGDMVVLLAKMGRAGVYAEALRAEGFECVVTGGSLFASADEVGVVARFVEALANPANTQALFEVLTSDMLRVCGDDLLELATEQDSATNCFRRRDLDKGLARLVSRADELSPSLAHAVRLLDRAQREVRVRPVSSVVRDAVIRSGWMARLEGEGAAGMAVAANVLKTVRLIEDLEREGIRGLASLSCALCDELAVGLKEAPGALSGAGGDVVKIMTIHASKGLEFPIVALADFADAATRSSKLLAESCGSIARASLAAAASLDAVPQLKKRASVPTPEPGAEDDDADVAAGVRFIEGVDEYPACSQAGYRAAIAQRIAREELAEARRKLYVGLTRASEALVVIMEGKAASPGKPFAYAPLVDDIRSAMCGSADFPDGCADLPYGGSAPAKFERIAVEAAQISNVPDAETKAETGASSVSLRRFVVPSLSRMVPAKRFAWNPQASGSFSYSSVAKKAAKPFSRSHGSLEHDGQTDRATELGTAFHRAAQFFVETGCVPDVARLDALASAFRLNASQRCRLGEACDRWFACPTLKEVRLWAVRRAEVPFFVPVGSTFVEGSIDLLCTEGRALSSSTDHRALVVDYKTGGFEDESPDELVEKHRLQAQCYAYALLVAGFDEVELRFVRVEHPDESGNPQEVRYRFAGHDVAELASILEKMRLR